MARNVKPPRSGLRSDKKKLEQHIDEQREKISRLQHQMDAMKLDGSKEEDFAFPIKAECHANRLCLLGAVMEHLGVTVDSSNFNTFKDILLPNLFEAADCDHETVFGISKNFLAILSSVLDIQISLLPLSNDKKFVTASPEGGVIVVQKKKKPKSLKIEGVTIGVWRPASSGDQSIPFHFLQNIDKLP